MLAVSESIRSRLSLMGSIEQYKACFVAKCFTQEYEIDCEETFASVACVSSIHALLAVVAASKWNLF